MSSEKKKDDRSTNWATVVYPESAPDNWMQTLRDMLIPCFVSPLHDQDYDANGEAKKPHYHVQFCFDSNSKRSRDQIKEITDSIGGVGQEKLSSRSGYCRYLIHRDNPDKAQYNYNDIVCIGNVDLERTFGQQYNKHECLKEMMQFINEANISILADLADYAAEHRPDDWFKIITDSSAYFLDKYIKSRSFKRQREYLESRHDEINQNKDPEL